jgi:N-acetylmuramoyl-L-alanine amidase
MRKKKKALAFVLIFAFIYNLLPIGIVKAVDNINIISSTAVTVQEAKQWAKNKGATETFIGLADLYWKYASLRGGVNPAVAYVQAAKETGYGRFGGIINESYKNPCGLKIRVGGSDTDPNAHQRFNTWDEGVQAHLDHLALYAGAAGYPRSDTYDPRNFSSITGKATTVVSLGGNWAPSASYGTEIMSMYNEMVGLSESSKLRGSIDEPSVDAQVSESTLIVRGWALNPSGIKEVNVYINGVFKGKATVGLSRPDIDNIYKGMYTNAGNSGYKLQVDVSNLTAGNTTVRVDSVGNDGTTLTQSKNIQMKKLSAQGRIDEPSEGQLVSGTSLKVRGWAIAASGVKEVKVYVDGKLKGSIAPNSARPDIKNAFPSYPNAETSGYELTVNIADIAGGSRIIKTEEVANDGSVNTTQRTVNINKLSPQGRIDEPSEGQLIGGTSLKVRGWAIAASGVKEVKVYVDGKLKGSIAPNKARPDIKNAFPSYPNAGTSGYELTVNVADVAGGSRIIKTEEVANDGSVNTTQRTVSVGKLDSTGRIDEPSEGGVVKGDILKVRGWAISDSGVKEVKVYVDGKLKGSIVPNKARPDIKNAFPSYPNAETSGYESTFDISDIQVGTRVVKVEEVSNDGTIRSAQRTFEKKNLDSTGRIDEPSENQEITSNSLKVRGWAISGSGVKEVKIYVDGKYKGKVTPSLPRADIKNAYPTYKNIENSGYELTFDISDIGRGSKVIKTEEIANDGTIGTNTRTINISRKNGIGFIDEPSSSQLVLSNEMTISGWGTNDINTKAVNVYIDNVFRESASIGNSRPDVQSAYPTYNGTNNSGYSTKVNIESLAVGKHTIRVDIIGIDGSVSNLYQNFYYKEKHKLVVVDPGHNFGNDDGAYSNVGGVSYNERDLNMAVSLKLQSSLEAAGYRVVLTRNPFDREYLGVTESLTKRVNIANSFNADLFVSVHQNMFTSSSANGTEVYYTTETQDYNFPAQNRAYKLAKSQSLATSTVNNISSRIGTYNRGAKDGDLFVLRNTTMPAILVECGFISNYNDVKKLNDGNVQSTIASSITDGVNANL